MQKHSLLVLILFLSVSFAYAQDTTVAYATEDAEMCALVADLQSGSIAMTTDFVQTIADYYWQDGEANEAVELVSASLSRTEPGNGTLFNQYESVGSENYPDFQSWMDSNQPIDPETREEVGFTLSESGTLLATALTRGRGIGYVTLFSGVMPTLDADHFPVLSAEEAAWWDSTAPSVVEANIWFTDSTFDGDYISLYAESYVHPDGVAWSPALYSDYKDGDYWWDARLLFYNGPLDTTYLLYQPYVDDPSYSLWKYQTLAYRQAGFTDGAEVACQ